MMIKQRKIITSVFLIIIFLFACTNSNDVQIKDEITTGSSTSAGNPGYDEPEPLPVPSGSKFLVTSTDNESNAIAFATGGFESSYKLLISNQTLSTFFSDNYSTTLSKFLNLLDHFDKHIPTISKPIKLVINNLYYSYRYLKIAFNSLIVNKIAHAENNDCPIESGLYICLTVNKDGSIDPTPLPNFTNEDIIYYAYYDPITERISDQITENINTNVQYTTLNVEGTYSLVKDKDGNVLVISYESDEIGQTTTRIIKLKYENDNFKVVSGNFDSNYSLDEIHTENFSELFYNYGQDKFQLAVPDVAYSYTALNCGDDTHEESDDCNFEADTSYSTNLNGKCPPEDFCSFVTMKNKGERAYFSTEYTQASRSAYIIDLYKDEYDEESVGVIRFLDSSFSVIDLDTGIQLSSRSDYMVSLAFDVLYDEATSSFFDVVVVYMDSSNTIRTTALYKGNRTVYPAISKETPSLEGAIDLVVYSRSIQETSDAPTEEFGKAAVLVASPDNPSVQFLHFDLMLSECTEDMIEEEECDKEFYDGTFLNLDTENEISLSSVPLSWSLSDSGTIAYVLSNEDITVIDLNAKSIIGVIDISTAFGADKNISITTKSILFSDNHVLIGSDGIGSIIIYDVSVYEE